MKKYSFLEVFGAEIKLDNAQTVTIKEIEIPRIQRDYAQGRLKDAKKKKMNDKGKRFIEYLFKSLEEKRKVELDFVYGEINGGKLIPLDGQQRLTSLFLLYWIIAVYELKPDELLNLKNKLINFSYETRDSSRTFCKKLVSAMGEKALFRDSFLAYKKDIDKQYKVLSEGFESLQKELQTLESEKAENDTAEIRQKIQIKNRDFSSKEHELDEFKSSIDDLKRMSSFIKNESWYFNSYDNDPTIIAMLNMLDKMNSLYKGKSGYYELLTNLKFSILPLEQIYQPEELYIKMNARGKQLTNFENFKADLIGWMIDSKNQERQLFYPTDKEQYVEYGPRKSKMAYSQRFSNLIDNEWTGFLWSITKDYDPEEKNNQNNLKHPYGKLVDPLFLALFYRYLLFIKIEKSNFNSSRDVDKEQFFIELYSEKDYVKFDDIATLLDYKQISRFERIMNQLEKNSDSIFKNATSSWMQAQNLSAKSLFEENISFTERVALYAIFRYLENYNYDAVLFNRWMRVIWNIAQNTDLDNWYGTISCLSVVDEFVAHGEEIYKHLSNNNKSYSSESKSSQEAIKEEREKATLIDVDSTWEVYLKEAESHSYFKGSVKFLLSKNLSIENFKKRYETSQLLFKSTGINDEYRKDHVVLRYIISQLKSWEEITSMKLIDIDEKDPQHFLKQMLRKDYIIQPLQKILDCKGIDEINTLISTGLQASSSIEDEYRTIHELIYKDPSIENWMQNESDKSHRRLSIQKSEGRWFVCKAGAWRENFRDWLMLDSLRNGIISYLISNKAMKMENQDVMTVGGKYFCGYGIDMIQTGVNNSEGFLYRFKPNGDLLVDQMINNNISEEKALKYNYVTGISSESDIPGFFKKIDDDITTKLRPDPRL